MAACSQVECPAWNGAELLVLGSPRLLWPLVSQARPQPSTSRPRPSRAPGSQAPRPGRPSLSSSPGERPSLGQPGPGKDSRGRNYSFVTGSLVLGAGSRLLPLSAHLVASCSPWLLTAGQCPLSGSHPSSLSLGGPGPVSLT